MFKWLHWRHDQKRRVADDLAWLRPSGTAREPLPSIDPIEELRRIIGNSPATVERARGQSQMSPGQCREACGTLKWTRGELARAAGVTNWVVDAFEDGREVLPAYEAAMRVALEDVGIGFPFEIENGRVSPAGVTYTPPDRKAGH